jgi:hypothetical protein
VDILCGCRLRLVQAVQMWPAAAEISDGPVFRPALREVTARRKASTHARSGAASL